MTGQVYAVASGKGGVGKTTTAVNLGVMLRSAGARVAVVDADLAMANVAGFLGVDHEPTVHDVLAGEADLEEAMVENDGFGVVPGSAALEGYALADPAGLADLVEAVAEDHDYVIVDTPAGLSHEGALPLGAADGVLLVTTPDPEAVGDTAKTAELARVVGGTVRGVVVTRAGDDVDAPAIGERLGAEVLAVVPEDPAVGASTAASEPLPFHAPDNPATAAYRQLAQVLAGEAEAVAEAPAAAGSGREGAAPDGAAAGTEAEAAEGSDDVDESSRSPEGAESEADAEAEATGTAAGDADAEAGEAKAEGAGATEDTDATAENAQETDAAETEPELEADADEPDAAVPDSEDAEPEAAADSGKSGGFLSWLWPFG